MKTKLLFALLTALYFQGCGGGGGGSTSSSPSSNYIAPVTPSSSSVPLVSSSSAPTSYSPSSSNAPSSSSSNTPINTPVVINKTALIVPSLPTASVALPVTNMETALNF
ncbi:MAG: hypothetical protein GQ570_02170 [Helicobacteraceae bacterium]|nr:hypothetical protein [Helicobacteraceae bacterium]